MNRFLSARFADSLILCTCLAVTIPALALVSFSEPVADDFVRAVVVDARQYVQWVYSHWSGRWAAIGLEAILFSQLPLLSVYPVILWILHAVHFLGLLAFWHTLVGTAISLRGRLGLAVGSFAFLLAGYPEPGETVYWATGSVEYQLSMSLALFLLSALCSSTRSGLRPAQAAPRALMLGLLGLAITGFHELLALMLLGVLLTGTVILLHERRPNLGIWLTPLVFVALGTAVSLLAPGNLERAAAQFPHGHSVAHRVLALARLLIRVLRWIDVKLLAASVLLVLTFGLRHRQSQNVSRRASMRAWTIPLAGAAILLASCIAIAYITGGPGNGRVQNLLYTVFCIAWCSSLFTLLKVAPPLFRRTDDARVRVGRLVAAVLLCVSLLASINNGSATRDLLFDVVAWRRAMTHRYEDIRQAARLNGPTADVVLHPLVHPATFARGLDIGPDQDSWPNRAFAKYFGVRSVRVADAPVPPGPRRPGPLPAFVADDLIP